MRRVAGLSRRAVVGELSGAVRKKQTAMADLQILGSEFWQPHPAFERAAGQRRLFPGCLERS
jgi:hypothetical protein